jgi:4-hydroxythreonine-4-phosphate dehydrogenase
MTLPVIGITLGDGAGIGPEIVLKALSNPEIYRCCNPLVVGNLSLLSYTQKNLGLSLKLETVNDRLAQTTFQPGRIAIWDFPQLDPAGIKPGLPNKLTGEASIRYIKTAVELIHQGQLDAITTLPISKFAIAQAGYNYPGHTELLAELTQAIDYAMMLTGDKLRVVLVTTHCALNQVAKKINKAEILRVICLAYRCLPHWGVPTPRIAVAALNPHAGEEGLLGNEEQEHIRPAVEEAESLGINVRGPLPADSLFYRVIQGEFDVVIAMYHDQGLIPLKMIAFKQVVNVTLGLPLIRTSVGHGCAWDIAGKGIAAPDSLIAAVELASRAVGFREKAPNHAF